MSRAIRDRERAIGTIDGLKVGASIGIAVALYPAVDQFMDLLPEWAALLLALSVSGAGLGYWWVCVKQWRRS